MPATFSYVQPSGTNTFVPGQLDAQGSARLLVDYARNEKDWLVNNLMTVTPVKRTSGYYRRQDPYERIRVRDRLTRVWADGQPFPVNSQTNQGFTNLTYSTMRFAESTQIGYQQRDQSDIDEQANATSILGERLMVGRTIDFIRVVGDSNNHLTSHVKTATALGGGLLSAATGSNLYIQKALNAIEQQILLDTNGVVKRENLTLILSPTVANALSATQEVQQYRVNNQFAQAAMQATLPGQTEAYMLLPKLYGFNVAVMSETRNTGERGGADSLAFIADGNSIVVVARPGTIQSGASPATSFSTVHLFEYTPDAMKVEVYDEPHNKRLNVQAWDQYDLQLISPESGYLITSVLS